MNSRREFLCGTAVIGLGVVWRPLRGQAAEGDYEAMILACIDPRFQEAVRNYASQRNLIGRYSQFVIAGGSIGVVAPKFQDWHKAFWDNLDTSVQLHRIKKVIALNHRDCGAAKIAYGDAKVANREIETGTHRAALAEFRRQAASRQPKLLVETGLMALDGTIEVFD